jgi:hypothetical protein
LKKRKKNDLAQRRRDAKMAGGISKSRTHKTAFS